MREIVGPLHPTRVLLLTALLTPPIAVAVPRALAIVLPLAALLAAAGAWRKGMLRWPPRVPAVLLCVFLVWSGLSAIWALHPALVRSIWGPLAGLGVSGVALLGLARDIEDDARLKIGLALAAGVAIGLGLLFIEWTSGLLFEKSLGALIYTGRPFHAFIFNRGAASLAILVWPAAYALHLRFGRRAAAALVAAAFLIIAQFASLAAIVGLVMGLIVWLAAAWRPRPAAIILAAAIIAGAAAIPALPRAPAIVALAERHDMSVSVYHRLNIWRFAAEAVAQRPLLGWGLNASRNMPGGSELSPSGQSRLPLHPHNAFLQWWLELGAVGAAIGTAFLLAAIGGAMRLGPGGEASRLAQSAALAAIASGMLVAAVGYGIWQAWWMAVLWIAAALVAAAPSRQARPKSAARSPESR